MAIIIYLDGVGLRGVARILIKMDHKNFSTQTVMRWMAQAGQKIEQEELEFQNKIDSQKTSLTRKKSTKSQKKIRNTSPFSKWTSFFRLSERNRIR